ncbi:MAG TPA: DUF3536 domain-containing protein [Candidatus Limnocylindrales bacterium]|nr:DUF3536 domain-containing protein [Candidatus Limnocylindrales bacterium]
MSRGRLVVHGHFYQPRRADPFSGTVPREPSAAPYPDWTSRIDAECYRPNAERGNFARISWDLGPTLASWLAEHDVAAYEAIVAQDRGVPGGMATGMAQGYHHAILPLATPADRRTEIRWGLRDFELRFGRRPRGLWLPETAVDRLTLRLLVDEGVRHTILAPWQIAEKVDSRQPYRLDLGEGRSIIGVVYDGPLSSAVSFEPAATEDADRFSRERVPPRLATAGSSPGSDPVTVVIATDGELYGHHRQFRDQFLEHLVSSAPDDPGRGFDIVTLDAALADLRIDDLPAADVVDDTSWSCHHGVLRWTADCEDVPDGRWKGPLRRAFDRLAAGIDALTDRAFAALPGAPDRLTLRDGYVDVVGGARDGAAFAEAEVPDSDAAARSRVLVLLEAQRWRLAMYASDGWYWEDPERVETRQVMRAAARAARGVDAELGSRLEMRLLDDLRALVSPSSGADGAAIYRSALEEVGQPPPA